MSAALFSFGCLSALIAVAFGGARAHLLEKRLPRERLPMLEVGMRYQMMHSMGILWCAMAARIYDSAMPVAAALLFAVGIVVFSGVMYTHALTGIRGIMRLTPFGGLIFLAGWAVLALTPFV